MRHREVWGFSPSMEEEFWDEEIKWKDTVFETFHTPKSLQALRDTLICDYMARKADSLSEDLI